MKTILKIPKYFTFRDLHFSAIYFLMKGKKIVYIGISYDVFQRVRLHSNKDFNIIRIIPCAFEDLERYEKRWIIRFRPKYNLKHKMKWIWLENRQRKQIRINIRRKPTKTRS